MSPPHRRVSATSTSRSLPGMAPVSGWSVTFELTVPLSIAGRAASLIDAEPRRPALVVATSRDLWVAVDDAGRETLVPALADLLIDVDVAARTILVDDVPGLTAPEEPEDEQG